MGCLNCRDTSTVGNLGCGATSVVGKSSVMEEWPQSETSLVGGASLGEPLPWGEPPRWGNLHGGSLPPGHNPHMCACAYTCICVHACVCLFTCVRACMQACTQTCLQHCTVHARACAHLSTCGHKRVACAQRVLVPRCACTYVHMYGPYWSAHTPHARRLLGGVHLQLLW